MRKILVSIILFVLIFSLTGCKDKTSDEDVLKEKVTEEINLMESKILDMLNNCNNISMRNYKVVSEKVKNKGAESDKSQGEEGQTGKEQESQSSNSISTEAEIQKSVSEKVLTGKRDANWEDIKSGIEILDDIWGTVIEDLNKTGVNKDDILGFSDSLNMSIISIKNSDKPNAMQNLINMYSYIPKFAKNVYKDESMKNKINAKYHIVNAYTKIETEKWNEINDELVKADKYITNNMNNINQKNGNIEKFIL